MVLLGLSVLGDLILEELLEDVTGYLVVLLVTLEVDSRCTVYK